MQMVKGDKITTQLVFCLFCPDLLVCSLIYFPWTYCHLSHSLSLCMCACVCVRILVLQLGGF